LLEEACGIGLPAGTLNIGNPFFARARGPLSPPTIAQSSFQKIGWRLSMDKRAAFVPQPKKRLFVTIVTMKPGRISI
jgi:hypothetical protein